MSRAFVISSLTFSLILGFCSPRPCGAQDLVPVIQLSADEVAKAKQVADSLKNAHERNSKARAAWETFHQSYQLAHRDLAPLRFTEDFRHAFAVQGSPSLLDSKPVRAVELTPEEQRKLQALHEEFVSSSRAQQEAEATWQNYQYQLVAAHFAAAKTEGGTIVTIAGKQVRIPAPWNVGIAFTPDFSIAVPRAIW